MLALYLGMLGADFEVVDSPELRDAAAGAGRALPARRGPALLVGHRQAEAFLGRDQVVLVVAAEVELRPRRCCR